MLKEKELPFEEAEKLRVEASECLCRKRKRKLGQYLTPRPVARLMASMLSSRQKEVRLLDAGAGSGSLFAACVEELCARRSKPKSVHVTACEIDELLLPYLERTMQVCEAACDSAGIEFTCEIGMRDFLDYAVTASTGLFGERFTVAIMNPPYFKIGTQSRERKLIRRIGVETVNIYAGFVAGAIGLLADDGELVAITPRSFCNGPYFRPFREFFLSRMAFRRIHVFESRSVAFREDDVLQENVIFHARKRLKKQKVSLSSSGGPERTEVKTRTVLYGRVVKRYDSDLVIHVATAEDADHVAERHAGFECSLADLGIEVSTGRVVDFRAREYLRQEPEEDTVPLIYPTHIHNGFVRWPSENGKRAKANAIVTAEETAKLLVPNEYFVLVKRFSAKEERRRIVAAVYDPERLNCEAVGFENHLNYFHRGGRGLDARLAKGLAVFLNSKVVDAFFRQFSGHTQVNATDLRKIRYPTVEQLRKLGSKVRTEFPDQATVDQLVESII